MLFSRYEREAEGQHHHLSHLRPGYGVVWPERAVRVARDHPFVLEAHHLVVVGAASRQVREQTGAAPAVLAGRYRRRLPVRVALVATMSGEAAVIEGELGSNLDDIGGEVIAEVATQGGVAGREDAGAGLGTDTREPTLGEYLLL